MAPAQANGHATSASAGVKSNGATLNGAASDADTHAMEGDAFADVREKFVPITRAALIDRLSHPDAWPNGMARDVRRFFRYLDYWRQQQYDRFMMDLENYYEPFSPDSDLLVTRTYSPEERKLLQGKVIDGITKLLEQANYTRVDPSNVEAILTKESHYGLDLFVDLDAFEELLIYYRGVSSKSHEKRSLKKFWRKEEFEVPIFRRLCVVFKLKPFEQRVAEICAREKCSRESAEKRVKKLRGTIAPEVKDEYIYLKLFKNIPRSDIEMIFPNTRVRFRMKDKIKLGVTSSAGVGIGAFSAAGKIALATTNPIAAAGAVAGLGGVMFRQVMGFLNQRQRYMVVMAQNLYFHAMADNGGVLIKLADRAAEEDIKEEILLYTVLAKEQVTRADLKAVDHAIESYLKAVFDVSVDFDISDALERLIADGLVTEGADGTLHCLPPREALLHIDRLWDSFLDNLPDPVPEAGSEIDNSRASMPAASAR